MPEITLLVESIMAIISRQATVQHTPAQMFSLVNDVEAYQEFLPWCDESVVHKKNDDEVKATLTVAWGGMRKSFTTHNFLQKDKMIEIRLVDGPFKHLEGFWRFDPVDESGDHQCCVSMDLEFEFAGKLLDFAFGPIFQQAVGSLVSAFCKRADVLYAK